MGQLNLPDSDYYWITREIIEVAAQYAGGRVVSTLEGGYELRAPGRAAVLHIRALMHIWRCRPHRCQRGKICQRGHAKGDRFICLICLHKRQLPKGTDLFVHTNKSVPFGVSPLAGSQGMQAIIEMACCAGPTLLSRPIHSARRRSAAAALPCVPGAVRRTRPPVPRTGRRRAPRRASR